MSGAVAVVFRGVGECFLSIFFLFSGWVLCFYTRYIHRRGRVMAVGLSRSWAVGV